MGSQNWTHGLLSPERLEPAVADEFEKLIASLEAHLRGLQKDDAGTITLGGNAQRTLVQGPAEYGVLELAPAVDVNALDPGDATIVRLAPSAAVAIHGIKAPSSAAAKTRLLMLYNVGPGAATLKHQSTTATEADRLEVSTAADVILPADKIRAIWFCYDRRKAVWVQLNVTSVATTGGEASLVEVVNTTTETTVYSTTIQANTLKAGTVLRFLMVADLKNQTGASQNLNIRVKLGGVTYLGGTNLSMAAVATAQWRAVRLWVVIAALDTTSQQLSAVLEYLSAAVTAQGNWGTGAVNAAQNSATVDLGADQAFAVTVQWGAANANLSFRKHATMTEILS